MDSASTVVNPLRFPGQYEDSETGMHYNWFRYYNPDIGRYLRTDPISFYGGQNFFAYIYNNPINGIDPNGEKGILKWIFHDLFDGSQPSVTNALQDHWTRCKLNIQSRIHELEDVIKFHQEQILEWYDIDLNNCRSDPCPDKCREKAWKNYNKYYEILVQPYVERKAKLIYAPSFYDCSIYHNYKNLYGRE